MAMISGSLLEVACIYLSRVLSLLRTLAIAEYGYMIQYMACSLGSCVGLDVCGNDVVKIHVEKCLGNSVD